MLPTFDIFRGTYSDKNAIWVEAVQGLAAARDRMYARATEEPAPYFLFSTTDRLVLAIIDTTLKTNAAVDKQGAA
jgi:hypothetical protein